MKKQIVLSVAFLALCAMKCDDVMTKEKGTYIVNTTTLAKDVRGYRGSTPLKIYIKKNKIEKVEALKNHETPDYFEEVEAVLLPKWKGMTVKKALTTEVDGVTGATFSSKAVKENVKRGLEYYQKNK
ncbi:MAG: FMN-binding protein [Prevotella sp.]|nr:FMN-binding protein [Prevotella sp.]